MGITLQTDHIIGAFKDHLELENNQRVILSGRFGEGKTTFIKHFFDKHREEYFNIHLYPVNYSVAQNEDIFELIKFDILYELIKEQPDFEALDLNFIDSISLLDSKDVVKIITPFVGAIPTIGKPIQDVIEGVIKLYKIIESKEKEIETDELKKIVHFFQNTENTRGNIYENDFYTQLIVSRLNKIKATSRKVTITIDDVDRIDPEHIFRILNIFAAQFDVSKEINKFGIDCLILACDINNIQSIFHHRYGAGSGFNGYIGKFYSKEIFNFDLSKFLSQNIKLVDEGTSYKKESKVVQLFRSVNNLHYSQQVLLMTLVQENLITTKELLKNTSNSYDFPSRLLIIDGQSVENSWIPYTLIFEYLIGLYGSVAIFVEVINKLNSNLKFKDSSDEDSWIGELLLIASLPNLKKESLKNATSRHGIKLHYNFQGQPLSLVLASSLLQYSPGSRYFLGDHTQVNDQEQIIWLRQNSLLLLKEAVRNYVSVRTIY